MGEDLNEDSLYYYYKGFFLNVFCSEFTHSKTIYVITEVMKASRMTVAVFGDDDNIFRESLDGPIPIGFRYSKFRLASDGRVSEQVTTK